ncbi:MAG: class I lanthipeptide [Acidobacteriota bacterium]
MTKNNVKKLVLNKDTLRQLDADELQDVQGGVAVPKSKRKSTCGCTKCKKRGCGSARQAETGEDFGL